MLIATVTALVILFGGGSGDHVSVMEMLDELSSSIQEQVADETRAAEAEEVVAAMRTRLVELAEQVVARQQELIAVDRDYGAKRENFEAAFAQINQVWDAAELVLIEGQIQLREKITEDEWSAIYDELKKKRK